MHDQIVAFIEKYQRRKEERYQARRRAEGYGPDES
jgi:hypothetical protein